ncbi:uncharacterized protein [Spinacia oleracea]|uniref:Reverse transcriptase domain-containing protein n=1 Tax=Spinacia oleracea TaxID=3562 RepID=A0ABM3QXI1_SPIOL|nr:uncharacterized protein LOC130463056 [Spinacia oleracea]
MVFLNDKRGSVSGVNELVHLESGLLEVSSDFGETEHVRTEHVRTENEEVVVPRPDPNVVAKPWVNLFQGSHLTAKGTSLSFIAPTISEGSPVAVLDNVDIAKMSAIWDAALIMYVVGDKPSIGAVIRYIANEWKNVSKPQVFLHDDGYFIVKFGSKKDRDAVLVAGPHTFFGRPMITKPWTASFNFKEEVLRVIPVWVRLPNLPLCCWGPDSLSKIGSLIGVPLFADECTSKQLRISFARMLIEVDVTKDMPKSVLIQDSTGRSFTQKVDYDWLPPFCKDCKVIGHDCQVKKSNATRFQPAVHVPKKVNKVWKPKKVQADSVKSNHDAPVIDRVVEEKDAETEHTPSGQNEQQNVQDDGWRVVSRRRRESRTHESSLGLAQVRTVVGIAPEFSLDEDGVKEGNAQRIKNKFGSAWVWEMNYTCSPKVYGLHTIEHRRPLLVQGKWKSSSDAETKDFEEFIQAAGITELKSCGNMFSWSNKGQGDQTISSRIDRAFGCCDWQSSFPAVCVDYLNPGISDHFPLLLDCNIAHHQGSRPFKFFNYMASHKCFRQVVQEGWDTPVVGTAMFQVWQKLKAVKKGLKQLHHKEFARLEERIDCVRGELDDTQSQLAHSPSDVGLQEKERGHIMQLKKFLKVQECAWKQKSRIQWLQTGDSNSKFFFNAMKERHAKNSIDILYDSQGVKLTKSEDIKKEISTFYHDLIGSTASSLEGIDMSVVRKGKQLSADSAQALVHPVTTLEIDLALKGIDINKAPALDGFNSQFFISTWDILKEDIYRAVQEFFATGRMLKQINNTTVTLIPKVQNATNIKDFRPIACCSVVYKLISKILTHRMQSVIGEVVNNAQAGFIPGRNIADNILLATELVKCYSRKHISPRCMIKVDLKKAYDSLEWPFLKSMMQELGFSDLFIKWVMQCLSTVSYSILVNGFPTMPITAKKGLRQGDPMSPYLFALGMEYLSRSLAVATSEGRFNFHPRCKKLGISHMMFADDLLMFARADVPSVNSLFGAFLKFSAASGLSANLHKSDVYTAGISADVETQIFDVIGIKKGFFPFRYLGVPLTTRKLRYVDCKPLIEKTSARIRSWTTEFLSYAGRLQLVKYVLFGMQLYWCQIFVMPKKVMKEIQHLCRCFLWTGSDLGSKKAPVAWDDMCLPKSCGGWNLKNLVTWNKAAVLKHCWALSIKQDRLWVKWIHSYYVKHHDFWTMPVPNGLTWSLKKIWQQRDILVQTGGVDQFIVNGKFKISRMYKALHTGGIQVQWKRIVCNSKASPKATFITWLALQNRLPTKDRLLSWNINIAGVCEFCQVQDEKLSHLFFECHYPHDIWKEVLMQLGIQRNISSWQEEVQWAAVKSRSTKKKDQHCSVAFTETVYAVWLQRNASVFSKKLDHVDSVVRRILFIVACRNQ